MYDVAITYSLAAGRSVVEIGFGGETLEVELTEIITKGE